AGRGEDVVDGETGDHCRVHALDGHAELELKRAPLLELREPLGRRRDEEVADLTEEVRPERREELDALPCEHDLGCGRKLLAYAAHGTGRRAACELTAFGD